MGALKHNIRSLSVFSSLTKNIYQYYITIILLMVSFCFEAQNVTKFEYYIGNDLDNGIWTEVLATTPANQDIAIPLTGFASGFNRLSIRAFQDITNTWSLYHSVNFYISDPTGSGPISNLKEAEYWFDSDLSTAQPITGTPSELTESFVIPIGSLDEGFHSITIRIKNQDDIWSLYDKRFFYVRDIASGAPISNIQKLEYWFNNDPGIGGGTEIDIADAPGYTDSVFIPLGSLDDGFHEISIRAQNLDGSWSLFDKKRFFIIDASEFASPAPLDEIEFLYDAELGFGTGIPLAFTATGNPDEYLVEIPTDLVTCDLHDVWISMKNTDGNYSLYKILDDVDVFDNLPPTIVVFPNITAELDANGQASITLTDVNNGTFDDCELVSVVLNQPQFDYTCANLGTNSVTITATDAEAKISNQNIDITVVDLIPPVAVAQDLSVQLDANGNATITGAQIDNGSTDNCSVTNFSLDVSSFDCSDLGANTVTLTAIDQSGNNSTNAPTATVTVQDLLKPTVTTQNITVQLDATGNASITTSQIDNGSTDNCTISSQSLDITSFTCANLGPNIVTLTVTDQSGNSEIGTATVNIQDTVKPTVATQGLTVQLDASGNASITAAQIDNGSTDNCSISSQNLDISTFTCANLGANTVTLTVTDQSGNSETGTATVIVEDNINPVAIPQAFTAQLDASGNATITADDLDNSSTDNCVVTTKSIDVSSFTCANLGPNTVMLTVEDASGNSNTASATVTVEDSVNPTVVTQNITVQLDASGSASITTGQIDNGSTDNCSISSSSLDISSFDCNDLGSNTVTLSVIDQSNNTGTNTATVTVEDNINPIVIGQDITRDLAGNASVTIVASEVDNGSSDNCNFTLSIDQDTFNTVGDYPIVLTITDSAGNMNSTTVIVTIIDTLGVEDFHISAKNIQLYPNPTQDDLIISTNLIIDSIDTYDVSGRHINQIIKPGTEIDVRDLSAGVYFLKFRVENAFVTKRIVKE